MPAFWNMRLFNQVGTLGILCDPAHPAFDGFPTEAHSDWQWADPARTVLGRRIIPDGRSSAVLLRRTRKNMGRRAQSVEGRSC